MAQFNRNNKGGGGRFGKKSFSGRDDRTKMHDATCNKCGRRCQVPFRPTGERPVFCSDCFGKERGGSMPQRDGGRDFDRKDRGGFHSEDRRMYAATCDNCGKKCEVPFMPSEGRKTYCKECFDGGAAGERGNENKNADVYKGQFEALNTKIDTILNLLTPKSVEKSPKKNPAKKGKK